MRSPRTACGLLILAVFMTTLAVAFGQTTVPPSREAIAEALRHQEVLVRSMECRFELTRSPTDRSMLAGIKTLKGEKKVKQYYYTEESVRKHAYRAHWWRKGEKECLETVPLYPEGKVSRTTAYDGAVIRSIEKDGPDGPKSASLMTVEKAEWNVGKRTHPFAMLYEVPPDLTYSKLLLKGRDFSAGYKNQGGRRLLQVSIMHPVQEDWTEELLMDDLHRIIERKRFRYDPASKGQRLFWKWEFSQYEKHNDPSGEVIWFPQLAVKHFYLGQLSDGTAVEYLRETITIKEIKVNINIPDSRFILDLPKDARVYDGVTDQGWLPAGSELRAWTNPPSRSLRSNVWLWVGVGGACVIVSLGTTAFLRRQRRSAVVVNQCATRE